MPSVTYLVIAAAAADVTAALVAATCALAGTRRATSILSLVKCAAWNKLWGASTPTCALKGAAVAGFTTFLRDVAPLMMVAAVTFIPSGTGVLVTIDKGSCRISPLDSTFTANKAAHSRHKKCAGVVPVVLLVLSSPADEEADEDVVVLGKT